MAQKLITVLGVTGTQGSSVAQRFLKHSEWRVRGITRRPGSEKAKLLAGNGVEIVQGDLDNVDSLKRAFHGSSAIFSVTDYYGNLARVSESEELKQKAHSLGKSLDEYAGQLEKAQGINAAIAASDPDILSTLRHFIFSTLPPIKKISNGKYTKAYEFDSKAGIEAHIRQIPELSKRLSTITMGIYLSSWTDLASFAPHKEKDGSYHFLQLDWPGPHEKHPEVWTTQDTGAFAEGLILSHPPDTHVLGATAIVSKSEYAATWARALGVTAHVKPISEAEYNKFVPAEAQASLGDMLKYFNEYGYTGGNIAVKTPAELSIKTATLEEFFLSQDWSGVLKKDA